MVIQVTLFPIPELVLFLQHKIYGHMTKCKQQIAKAVTYHSTDIMALSIKHRAFLTLTIHTLH